MIHNPGWQEGHDFHCVWQDAATAAEAREAALREAALAVLASRTSFTLENGSGGEETGWEYDEAAIAAMRAALAEQEAAPDPH